MDKDENNKLENTEEKVSNDGKLNNDDIENIDSNNSEEQKKDTVSNKVDNKQKYLILGIAVVIMVWFSYEWLNKEPVDFSSVDIENLDGTEISYNGTSVNVDAFLNNTYSTEETEKDLEKVQKWVENLKGLKHEGLAYHTSDKYTYIYMGVNHDDTQYLNFEFGPFKVVDRIGYIKIGYQIYEAPANSGITYDYDNIMFVIDAIDVDEVKLVE